MSKENLMVDRFFELNNQYITNYKKSSLLQLMESTLMEKKENRILLLDAVQIFSNYFQKVVLLRNILTDDLDFYPITVKHLKEEFLHNEELSADRNFRAPIWDPILESTSAWFVWKMFTLNNEGRMVLIHLVLETSANIFFSKAHKVMEKYAETNYFKLHNELDEEHAKLGIYLLNDLAKKDISKLLLIQKQGWDILNTVCDRIASLVKNTT